jgi:hypothetical protein
MPPLAEITKIKAELEKLESALKSCIDCRIREVIEIRIEKCRVELAQPVDLSQYEKESLAAEAKLAEAKKRSKPAKPK